jgi:hypothetical protein
LRQIGHLARELSISHPYSVYLRDLRATQLVRCGIATGYSSLCKVASCVTEDFVCLMPNHTVENRLSTMPVTCKGQKSLQPDLTTSSPLPLITLTSHRVCGMLASQNSEKRHSFYPNQTLSAHNKRATIVDQDHKHRAGRRARQPQRGLGLSLGAHKCGYHRPR